jgi:hypothetical protein
VGGSADVEPLVGKVSRSGLSHGKCDRDVLPLAGAVAQLGERLICIQEVAGSIPTSSTRCGQGGLETDSQGVSGWKEAANGKSRPP